MRIANSFSCNGLMLGLVLVASLGSVPIAHSRDAQPARPLTLASADFDIDGYPELVTGYGTPEGGFVEVRRGNPEAFAPRDPAVLEGIAHGRYPSPFLPGAQWLRVPASPDFMAAGDFDRDRNPDLVVAARGGRELYLLAGDGRGGFSTPQIIPLSGRPTALTSGEFDVPDDRPDLVVGVAGDQGASILVYEGAERGILDRPEAIALEASASALALGPLDDSPFRSLAIVAAGDVMIVHGRYPRDRADAVDSLASRMEKVTVPFGVKSLTIGAFEWNREGREQMALVAEDGSLHVARLGIPDARPYTVDEVKTLRRRRAESLEQNETNLRETAWSPGSALTWRIEAAAPPLPFAAGEPPVATLALRLGIDAQPGSVILRAGETEPVLVPQAVAATILVNDTTDTIHSPGCATTGTVTCSLRDAIIFSNANAGTDTITFAAATNGIPFTLSIANTGGVNEDAAQKGDLDINDSVTIVGNGSGITIIQAGTNNANGIDKVFAVNPFCTSAVTASVSGVTIRYGRNTQPNGAADFSFTGGGLDWCDTGTGGLTISNSVISDNTNVNGYGGGINLDSVAPATGTVSITGTTIIANKTLAAGAGANGGGMNLFADKHNVTLTNCQITNNTATSAEGGGLFIRHTNGGVIAIHGSTISGNVAGSRGGGVSILGVGPASNTQAVTIDQSSSITGNTSQGTAGLTAEGGGVYSNSVSTATTTTLDKVTLTGNTASLASADQRGGGAIATGGGAVTVHNCRIAGNAAGGLGGAGLHKDLNGGTTNATGNWWGCSTTPSALPCDTTVMSGGGSGTPVLTVAPYIVLTHTASPSGLAASGQATLLTASFLKDSGGGAIPLANLDVLIGRPITFNNAVLGNLSSPQATIQASGTATATFTASSCGNGSANATVDNGSSTAPIVICPPVETAPGIPGTIGLEWTNNTTLTWPVNSQAGSGYRLYRTTKSQFANLLNSSTDSCLRFSGANQNATTASGLTDDPVAVAEKLYGYLVTGVNIVGEGSAGNATAGARIVNSSGSCP
jgi:hypothetical protein